MTRAPSGAERGRAVAGRVFSRRALAHRAQQEAVLEYTFRCSTCHEPLSPQATRCPVCDAVAPTRPPLALSRDELAFEPLEDLMRPRAWLRVDGSTARIEIDRPLVLGRSPAADVRLPGTTVSRRHALVIPEGTSYRAIDLGSLNGLYVNEVRVVDRELGE